MTKYAVAWIGEMDEDLSLEIIEAASKFEAAKKVLDSEDWEYDATTYSGICDELYETAGFRIKVIEVASKGATHGPARPIQINI